MDTGDVFFIYKSESEKDVFIYLMRNFHLSFGRITINVFPSYEKKFKEHLYIDTQTKEVHFRSIKELPDADILPKITDVIMQHALEAVFNSDKF